MATAAVVPDQADDLGFRPASPVQSDDFGFRPAKAAPVAPQSTPQDDTSLAPPVYSFGQPKGLRTPGNININDRPIVSNPYDQGKDSTVYSMSMGTDNGTVLVPRVSDGADGKPPHVMSEKEAEDYYHKTGQHLGVFDSDEDADAYSEALHNQQATLGKKNGRTEVPVAGASGPLPNLPTHAAPPPDSDSFMSKAWEWMNSPANIGHLRESLAQAEADSNAGPTMADVNSPLHAAGTLIKHAVEGFGADAGKMLLTPLSAALAGTGGLATDAGVVGRAARAASAASGVGFGAAAAKDAAQHGLKPNPSIGETGYEDPKYIRRVLQDAAMVSGGAAGLAHGAEPTTGEFGAKGIKLGNDAISADLGFRPAYRQPSPEGSYGEGSTVVPGKVQAGVTIGGKRFGTSPEAPAAAPEPQAAAPDVPARALPANTAARPVVQGSTDANAIRESAAQQEPTLKATVQGAVSGVDGAEVTGSRVKDANSQANKADRDKPVETQKDHLGVRIAVESPEAGKAVEQSIEKTLPVVGKEPLDNNGLEGQQIFVQTGKPGEANQISEIQILPKNQVKALEQTDDLYDQQKKALAAGDKEKADALSKQITEIHKAALTGEKAAEPKYKFGSTQANLPATSDAAKAIGDMQSRIPDEDLAGDGKDIDKPHVTVRYGLKNGITPELRKFIESQKPFEAHLGETTSFPPSENSDGAAPIIAPVESPELHKLNAEIEKQGDFEPSSFPDYKPHVTVAYVKPEMAEKYSGLTDAKGKSFPITSIAVSDRNGEHTEIPLKGGELEKKTVGEDSTKQRFDDFMTRVGTRLARESHGQGILDKMDEAGESPRDVSKQFWEHTYFDMPAEAQQVMQRQLKAQTGMQPGDTIMVRADKSTVEAKDWQDIAEHILDLPDTAEGLQGTERGIVAMMRDANDRFGSKSQEKGESGQSPEPAAGASAPAAKITKGASVTLSDGTNGTVAWTMGGKARIKAEDGARRDVPLKDVKLREVKGVTEGTPEQPQPVHGAIAVDLDKTLAEYDGYKGPTEIGKPITSEVERVKQLIDDGKDVWIYSARAADPAAVPAMKAWTKEHFGKELPITNIKYPQFDRFIDDRAEQPIAMQEASNAVREQGVLESTHGESHSDSNNVPSGDGTSRGEQKEAGRNTEEDVRRGENQAAATRDRSNRGDETEESGNAPQERGGEPVKLRGVRVRDDAGRAEIRASRGDGGDDGSPTAENGARSPQERKQEGQPSRESGVADKRAAFQAAQLRRDSGGAEEGDSSGEPKSGAVVQKAPAVLGVSDDEGSPRIPREVQELPHAGATISKEVVPGRVNEENEEAAGGVREPAKAEAGASGAGEASKEEAPASPAASGDSAGEGVGNLKPGAVDLFGEQRVESDEKATQAASKLGSTFYSGFADPELFKRLFPDVASRIENWLADEENPGHEQRAMMRQTRGEMDRRIAVAMQKLSASSREWRTRSREDSMAFWNAVEQGKVETLDAKDQALAKLFKGAFDQMRGEIQQLKPEALQNYIENYFPHLWEKESSVSSTIKGLLTGKRPFAGKGAFLKKRTIPTMQDGIDLGFKPKTWNPVESFLMKYSEMAHFLMGHQTLQMMKDAGSAKFVRIGDEHPEGWTQLDDRIGTVYGKEENAKGNAFTIIRGHYYAPADAAKVFNNFVSRGVAGRSGVYDSLNWVNQNLNALQLGISAFHAATTTINAATSDVALGIQQLAEGKPFEAGASMLKGASIVPSMVSTIRNGSKLLQEYLTPGSYEKFSAEANALAEAGGRVRQNTLEIKPLDQVISSWRNGAIKEGLSKLPAAILEATVRPVMEYYVPRMKVGAFYSMAHDILEQAAKSGESPKNTRAKMQRAWDSIDNRFGQVVYDNFFWHKGLRDALQLSQRSVGWNFGDIRELGGGAIDAVKQAGRASSGERPEVTPRMAFALALPMVSAMIGGVLTYLWTGKKPDTWKDYFYPKTADGTRHSIPGYMKDVFSFAHAPVNTALNKLAPIWALTADAVNNRDFYGTEIRHKDDPMIKQLGEFSSWAAKQAIPFSFSGAGKLLEKGGGEPTLAGMMRSASKHPGDVILGQLGLQPAPASIQNSEAMNAAHEYAFENRPPGTKTEDESNHQKAFAAVVKMYRSGRVDHDQIERYRKEGKLPGNSVARAAMESRYPAIVVATRGLGIEQLLNVYDKGTPQEKDALRPVVARKYKSIEDISDPDRKQTVEAAYERAINEGRNEIASR